jgi:hypothetical protein
VIPVCFLWFWKLTVRYADDEAMNRELREVERWDDPALQFATVSVVRGRKRIHH